MSDAPLVLVVDDEPQMRRFLRAMLQGSNYRLLEAETGAEAMSLAAQYSPDLVLLDLGLPDTDGLEITRRIREWSQVPIIVVSARGKEDDKVVALDAGADDYLTKPFGARELLARIRVALRHRAMAEQPDGSSVLSFGDVTLDLAKRRVTRAGEEVHLTPIEYRLFLELARHAGRVLTHRQLLREVWGPGASGQTHYLRVFMAQLRHKLEQDPARPKLLLTEPGVGYRLESE